MNELIDTQDRLEDRLIRIEEKLDTLLDQKEADEGSVYLGK